MNQVYACIDGLTSTAAVIDGAVWSAQRVPRPAITAAALVKAQGAALRVMDAYGHSRIRQLIVGSTTSTLLRLSEVPALILR